MFNPQMTSSQMELLPLVCLCLLSWSGTTSAGPPERVVVAEGGDAVLKCSFDGINMENGVFDWTKGQKKVFVFESGFHPNNGQTGQAEQFKGRVSHFQDELKHGNTSIKITKATMADSGNYTCIFPNNFPSPTFNVQLVVGAAPKPFITTLLQTKNSALLQCEAHGVPDPEVHWQDSDGNKLTAEEPQVTESKHITVKTTVNKTGRFYCVATQKNINHTVSAEIFVLLPVVVEEGSDVILPCSFGGSIEGERLEWKKDGQQVLVYDAGIQVENNLKLLDNRFSHFKEELKHGNASILIRNTKVADSGNYTCDIPHNPSHETVHVELFVDGELRPRPDAPGAAPKPFITTLLQTKSSAVLQCEAHGAPDPEVHWQDSDGNKLTAEKSQVTESGREYIILKTTVTKTDNFYCVATQKNISHEISAKIHVYIDGIVVVKEGGDVILPCSPNFNTESETFHWKKDGQKVFVYVAGHQTDDQAEQFRGRVSHFQHELKHGNASIKITKTKMTDSGDYTCEFPNIQTSPTFKIELVVVGEDKPQTDNTGLVVVVVILSILFVSVVVVLYVRELKHKRGEKKPEEETLNQQN